MLNGNLRLAAVTTVGCLLSFGAAMLLSAAGGQGLGPLVLAVVLSFSLVRNRRHTHSAGRLAVVVAATVGAGGVAWLLTGPLPWLGDAAFVLLVAGGIAIRRFGPAATSVGVAATMPVIGLLVVPAAPQGPLGLPTLAATAVTTILLVAGTRLVAVRAGFLPAPVTGTPSADPPRPVTGLRGSDRMAIQMAVGLTAAFVVGRWAFGPHWSWVVLTAYVVAGGARSRGDVLHRGVLRMAGAAAGTVLATLIGLVATPGSPWVIVAVFAVLAVANALRARSYAWWAGGVTAVVALLADYLGQDAAGLLLIRLGAIAAGGVLAVAAAWFLLPIRTSSVVRRRVADALAALHDVLHSGPDDAADRRREFAAALERLREIAPSLRFHRRLPRRGRVRHPANTVDALLSCADVAVEPGSADAARHVTMLRRGMRAPDGHLAPGFAELPGLVAAREPVRPGE